jgi:hypothetical protein
MPVLACFVGAAAAAPTRHLRTGTFVRMLGDLWRLMFIYAIGLCNGDGVLCEVQAEVKETVDHKKITTKIQSFFCEIRAEAKEAQSKFNN